jgi:2-amino-4-hydroxy-6-hydroxymethyldihydropteridine diphosphokinase
MGSNLGDRALNLREALRLLARAVHPTAVSSLYETAPMGVADQPAFLNLALAAESDRDPFHLLRTLKSIEQEVGRRPTFRWGPRVVDIDILLYGDHVMATPQLTIPHPEMPHRAFVLVPLTEVAATVRHPVLGETLDTLCQRVPGRDGVKRVGPPLDLKTLRTAQA